MLVKDVKHILKTWGEGQPCPLPHEKKRKKVKLSCSLKPDQLQKMVYTLRQCKHQKLPMQLQSCHLPPV